MSRIAARAVMQITAHHGVNHLHTDIWQADNGEYYIQLDQKMHWIGDRVDPTQELLSLLKEKGLVLLSIDVENADGTYTNTYKAKDGA